MLQVIIKSVDGSKQWQGQFETQEEIDSWIAQNQAVNAWGKPERTLTADADGNVPDEDVLKATSSEEVEIQPEQTVTNEDGSTETIPAVKRTQYTFAADYTISDPVDISAQIAQRQAVSQATAARIFGQSVLDNVWAVNVASKKTVDEMKALASDETLSQIVFFLQTGSINTAHDLIKNMGTAHYTQAQIDTILSMIEASPFYEAPTQTA